MINNSLQYGSQDGLCRTLTYANLMVDIARSSRSGGGSSGGGSSGNAKITR